MPPYCTETFLPSGFERKLFERDDRGRTGAVVEPIGQHDATLWVPADTHRRGLMRTTMDEF